MKDHPKNDGIVISGIAGKFPQCNNVDEFKEALYSGVDLVDEMKGRHPPGIFGTPRRAALVPDIDKFDASYFKIHPKQVNAMDPRQRLLLENAYECIIDAGYNPKELRGKKIGVYVGITSFSNFQQYADKKTDGYLNIGVSLALAANRISYHFDLKGPSFSMDTACSSAMFAFVNAVRDMQNGETEGALVCGTNLLGNPKETDEFNKLNMLSSDGKCKVFTTERDGYARAETVSVMFLQKKSQSRRIYATVHGAKCNSDGYKAEGITVPSAEAQLRLMRELYEASNIDPNDVSYVEAHGTGTPIGDLMECQSLVEHYCKTREGPLPIGAVKTNMGHSEMASALCSIAKVLLAMESGVIPANLYADIIDKTLPGIKDGKLQVVGENLNWKGGIVGVNCFGFGGANAHCILESYSKEKNINYKSHKNRLVQVSGRTEEAVKHFINEIQKNQDDPEFLALVDEIHKLKVDGHNYRGYTVLGEQSVKEVGKFTKVRPIWFVYTGMGCQWTKMGKDLMNNAIFRKTIDRCAKALKPYGVDLINIITSEDPEILNSNMNCFCAIISIEVALTDVLYSLGINPDGYCGHSLGETGCAYADGFLTPEQAVLLAYARGYGIKNAPPIEGQMAAIGLSKEEVSAMLPEGIFLACQNSKGNVTISGPKEEVVAFVEQLSSQGVFARLVQSGSMPFHTKYVHKAGDYLLDFCKKVITDPKPRSKKWFSTSVPPDKQNESWAQLNCAEYHHYNFCNPVLFDQIFEYIPDDAIVVEIAPHGLLQAILKREMGTDKTIISATNRSSKDNEQFFLSAVGKIFLAGAQPNLRNLYDDVTFPVSRGTKMLSPLVKWDHGESWFSGEYKVKDSFGNIINVNLSEEKYAYLADHEMDGRVLMPATGYLGLVWDTLAELHLKNIEEMPIVVENLKLKRATVLSTEDVKFLVNIMLYTGHFEICESGSVVCTGTIRIPKDIQKEFKIGEIPNLPKNVNLSMKRVDVYKECFLRRYNYNGFFQGIIECDISGLNGIVEWMGEFGSFLDTMLHLSLMAETSRDLMLPTYIQQIIIDPIQHLKMTNELKRLTVSFNPDLNIVKCGGIEIVGLSTSKAPRRQNLQEPPYLETCDFISYESKAENQYDLDTSIRIAIQIILQNIVGTLQQISVCEIVTNSTDDKELTSIKNILDKQAFIEAEYSTCTRDQLKAKYDTIVISETVLPPVDLHRLLENLTENGFILYKGKYNKNSSSHVQTIFESITADGTITLLRPAFDTPENYSIINVTNENLDWLEDLKTLSGIDESKVVYLVSQDEEISGILGLVRCLLHEPMKIKVRSCFVDQVAEKFSIENPFYRNQMQKNLVFNVLKKNSWGTFVYLPLRRIEKSNVSNASISIMTLGDLSTIDWVERPLEGIKLFSEAEQVYVYYSALNFKDVMIATGKLASENMVNVPTLPNYCIGLEYAGITTKRKRVMGMVGNGSIALQTTTDPSFTWEVPNNWTLRDACTVPCVYATCYYAMIIRGQMQPGESILIHAGTGGIGLAAINIALSMDCQVYTTVSTKEKRDFLKYTFPMLEDKNIGNSRDTSFEQMIKINTKGRGVNLVLNSLADDLFQASMRCLANRGRFLEIGKVDLTQSSPIPSSMFLRNISFHGIFVDELFYPNCSAKQEIHRLITHGITAGVVKPLPIQLFTETEVESAFRFLAAGKHKGKVLIEIRKEETVPTTSPKRTISAIPQVYFNPRKSYILIGGLGGIGLELTDWMIRKGATKIILNSRRSISNGYQAYCIKKWSQFKGVTVKINTNDTSNIKEATDLVNVAQEMGPVGGIFNLALVLKDALIKNQTKENYEEVFKAKIVSGKNMDKISRTCCPELDHFVVFSSIASGRGNIGQTNYGMSNSALERLCEKRKREGLPGLAVQWGPVGDVGALKKMGVDLKEYKNLQPQKIASCLSSLETFMLQPCTVGSSVVLVDSSGSAQKQTTRTPVEAVAHILGIKDLDSVDKSLTLSELGLDSLMLTEIKQTLYRNFELEVSLDEIRNFTLNSLSKLRSDNNDDKESESQPSLSETSTFLLSNESVLKMNTLSDSVEKNIFLIHPIEGHVSLLKPLANKLKATVYGFQCTKDNIFDKITDFASYFNKQIKEIQPKGPYLICSYSYGVAISTEMVLQLEQSAENCTMICIDGSPSFVREILKNAHMKKGLSVETSEQAILEHFCQTFPQVDQKEIHEVLKDANSWEDKVERASGVISRVTEIDRIKVSNSIISYFKRVAAGYFYEPSGTIKGKVFLIRRVENPFLSENYELQKICSQPVGIEKIPGDHKSILLGENTQKVADVINKFLM